jgi:hypothetical protein
VRGNINLQEYGATLFGNIQQQNSEIAGFYGANTLGGGSTGLVQGLCISRPWSSSFLSYVIPPSFFDSLCSWRGYQVGLPPAQTSPSTPSVSKPAVNKPTPEPPKPPVTPRERVSVEIWAEPSVVSLGSRTTIFWDTSGVAECSETSSDGNFSESTLSGGSATVPITGATTFTITCLTADGRSVVDNTVVELAI